MSQTGRAAGSLGQVSGRLSPLPMLQIATGFWASQALLTAVDLRVFTVLAGGLKTAAEVAQETGTEVAAMEALLDANCSLGFAHRQGDRYRNDPAAAAFLVEGTPGSYVDLLRYMRDPLFKIWGSLRESVQGGQAAIGPDARDAAELALARAFHYGGVASMMRVAEILDIEFSALTSILDVGSRTGPGALCLARRYPQVQATLLDRPVFGDLANELIRGSKLESRVRFVAGDPDQIPSGTEHDLVLLSHHLGRSGRAAVPGIVKGVHGALRPKGMLLVTEFLLEDSRSEPKEAALYRLNALGSYGSDAAGALTRSQLYDLLGAAGFTGVDMVGLPMFGVTAITAVKS